MSPSARAPAAASAAGDSRIIDADAAGGDTGVGWLVSPIQALLDQRHPLAFLVLLPIFIVLVRLLLRWLGFLSRILFRGSGLSPGYFLPRRVQGSVHTYGVVELKGRRPYMEDRHIVVPSLLGDDTLTLYGVFDGHGGDQASQYCSDHLGTILENSPEDVINKPQAALTHAFKTIDRDFLDVAHMRKLDDGTTALVALAHGSKFTVANAGDSRAVLVQRNGRAMPLSQDHKPDRSDERDRIARLGGTVIHWGVWRVEGVLAVSRAIGDRLLKDYVIPDPEFVTWACSSEDMFMVLATDGLWDVLDNDQVAKMLANCVDAQAGAEALTQAAFAEGTLDNVTVLIIDVRHAAARAGGKAGDASLSGQPASGGASSDSASAAAASAAPSGGPAAAAGASLPVGIASASKAGNTLDGFADRFLGKKSVPEKLD